MNHKITGKGLHMKDKLIEATARIIREEGFREATVRNIADRSHVNISSIRYYFGTKEELLGRAIDYLMANLENIVSYLDDDRYSPRDRLIRYIRAYFRLAQEHPALFRAIAYSSGDAAQNTYFIYLSLLHDQCWEKVIHNVSEVTGLTDRKDLELKCMQIFSAIEFPIILQSNEPDSFVKNYLYPACIDRYIDLLLGPDRFHGRSDAAVRRET